MKGGRIGGGRRATGERKKERGQRREKGVAAAMQGRTTLLSSVSFERDWIVFCVCVFVAVCV